MKKIFFLSFIAIFMWACQEKESPKETSGNPALDVNWKLDNNLVNEAGEARWLLTLQNNAEHDLPSKGWSLYFNHLLNLKIENEVGLNVSHVNGDLWVIRPNEKFKGIKKGSELLVKILSGGSIMNITDAPLGFYISFDNNPEKALACKSTLEDLPIDNLNRNTKEILPVFTPEIAYEINSSITPKADGNYCPIIPTPSNIEMGKGTLKLENLIKISGDPAFSNEEQFLKKKLSPLFNGEIILEKTEKAQIILKLSDKFKDKNEAYSLNINANNVTIEASTKNGAFYGVQSLLALVPTEAWKTAQKAIELPQVQIQDEPRFEYRGLFLDVSRNFQPKENVLRILDRMAFYKLNKFHFHICDDEGWRLEINGLPELTEFGAFRGYSHNESKYLYPSFGSGSEPDPSVSHGSGFYTQEDFVEILKYATERNIEVIPEIDMPGHARAAIRSMQVRYDKYMKANQPEKAIEYLLQDLEDKSEYKSVQGWTDNVIDVSMESSYRFLEKVTDEVISLFKQAGAPLTCIHTGGDEVPKGVWEKSPSCNNLIKENQEISSTTDLAHYFIERFSTILADRGLVAAGWEEIALIHGETVYPNPKFVGKNLRPFVWNNMWNSGAEDIGYQLANTGYPVVLAHVTNFYFDLAYNKNPKEYGYYWGNFIDTRKPWEYIPMDIAKCAEMDRFGHKIDPAKITKEIEPLTEKGKANILGLQGLLWSENNLGRERMEYFFFPKILGLAERAWSQQPEWATIEEQAQRVEAREKKWSEFVHTVGQRELPRMDHVDGGILYRVPTPGAKIENGQLHANVIFPGLEIRYTVDGTEPNQQSKVYTEPVAVSGTVKLKCFTTNGRSSNTVSVK